MKTKENKINHCHCGKEISSKAKVCCREHRVNPNTHCKECGCEMPSTKKLGRLCYVCENKIYSAKRKTRYDLIAAEKKKLGLEPKKKYVARSYEFTEEGAMEWIEMVIARNEMVSIKELFVDLIDVYYVTKNNDEYEHFTPKKQLEYMWKQCLNWYLKNKKK